MSTLHPLQDYLLIKRDESVEPTTAGGIIMEPGKEVQRTRGTVVSVGPGTWREGQFRKVEIEVGTHVVFKDGFLTQKEKVDGVEYLLIPETEIIGVLSE